MKRALLLMILSWLALSLVTAQEPAKVAPKHYKVAAAEAPNPRITPDGRYRYYMEEDGEGNDHLFLRDLTTGETRRLTKGPGWTEDAIMSPDGRQIAYVWFQDQLVEIRIVGIDGSEPRVRYSNGDVPLLLVHEWSPDGEYVAATIFQKDRTSQLVLVSVADASVRVLRTQVLKTLNYSNQWHKMSFSPDGRFVAYDLTPQGGWHPRDILAIPVEGGPEIPLVQHQANDLLLGWTPDGRGVLFASDRSGQWDLWDIEVSDGQPRGSPEMVKPNFGSFIDGLWFSSLGFTRDGSYYYRVSVQEIELYLATLDPANNSLRAPTKLASHTGERISPDWSRDGRYLAYAWGRGTAYDPFILGIRSDQTGEERELRLDGLIRHGGHGFDPRWSPDGRFILADARERDYAGPLMDSQGLYRIDVQTGSVTPLVQTTAAIAGIDSPVWSPDGRVIFERRPPDGPAPRIVTRDLETGEEKELYRAVPPAQVHHWPTSNTAVSPNGQRLAFVWTDAKNVGRATALMVLPTAGGEPRELLRAQEPAVISVPAWTPDSRHLIYARTVQGEKRKFELWRISAEGGEPQNLGLLMEGLEPYGLSVHPDGKRIAFTAGTEREEVWVLQDFLPGGQSALSPRHFTSAINLEETSEDSANLSMGDLDGDGDLDLVLAKGRHTPLLDRVLLNDGKGRFVATDLGPTADRTYSAVLADIDGDGDLEILVSNDTPDSKLIYLNDGKAHFRTAGTWGAPEWSTRNAAVADLNGDRRPDVIAANRPGPSYVCLNDGGGRFASPCIKIPAESATSIVPADFNKDGSVDLAVPHRDGGQSLIFINDGRAGFATTLPFGPPDAAARVAAAADFNGDGWQDLVVGDEKAASMVVYINDSHGNLSSGFQVVDKKRVPYAIEVGDMNRDGHADIVIGYIAAPASVFFNDGTGRRFLEVPFGDGRGDAYGFALGDLNDDRYPDIAVARSGAPNVMYFSEK